MSSAAAPSGPPALVPGLKAKLSEYRSTRKFDPKDWIAKKSAMFNDYMSKCGLKACVVSLSGGVDSAVTLALMKYASNQAGSPIQKCLAVAQPISSSQWAVDRARESAKSAGVELVIIDQTEQHKALASYVSKEVGIAQGPFADGQLRSYMRTPVGYYVAQLLSSNKLPCIVMGTGNMDEDGYLAYFCKAGDGVVDVQLIADLHKSEVFAVGAELGVPQSILVAAPSADLWEAQTDEEELGFTYDFVELFTGYFLPKSAEEQAAFIASLDAQAAAQFEAWSASARQVHARNQHKFGGPKNLNVIPVPYH